MSEIFYRSLDQVIRPGVAAFVARVTAMDLRSEGDEHTRTWTVEDVRWLAGTAKTMTKAAHVTRDPVMRNAAGEIEGWYSPIIDASGYEDRLDVGQEAIFLRWDMDASEPRQVIRVEPMTSLEKVRRLLSRPPDLPQPD